MRDPPRPKNGHLSRLSTSRAAICAASAAVAWRTRTPRRTAIRICVGSSSPPITVDISMTTESVRGTPSSSGSGSVRFRFQCASRYRRDRRRERSCHRSYAEAQSPRMSRCSDLLRQVEALAALRSLLGSQCSANACVPNFAAYCTAIRVRYRVLAVGGSGSGQGTASLASTPGTAELRPAQHMCG